MINNKIIIIKWILIKKQRMSISTISDIFPDTRGRSSIYEGSGNGFDMKYNEISVGPI